MQTRRSWAGVLLRSRASVKASGAGDACSGPRIELAAPALLQGGHGLFELLVAAAKLGELPLHLAAPGALVDGAPDHLSNRVGLVGLRDVVEHVGDVDG